VPFTPFHFGPGLLIKSCVPRRFSMLAFVASQVIIDVESLYWLLQDTWPVHRLLHTFIGGAIVGVIVTVVLNRIAHTGIGRRLDERYRLSGETAGLPVAVGGLVGGLSHSLLDGIMHADIQPFRPMSGENPLLGWISVVNLHLACVVMGLAGIVILAVRKRVRRAG
jgi:hypothetical protein